ncbi:MAG TPA: NlpC/P60 family protein [Pseudoxanthomonas sp.]|nr:NlpC/P60 family protein [Pseudoxanthomonas sp.]
MGKPYRFGRANPSTGFDCSGLIQYSFRRLAASASNALFASRFPHV